MQHPSTERRRWRPESESDRERLRYSLNEVLSTSRFASSKRYPALLQYLVEKTLCGDIDSLKERTIGIDVFNRPPNYDTGSDTVVRYTAGEVRKRLTLYYHEDGAGSPIQIALPSGSYVPEFYVADSVAPEGTPPPVQLHEAASQAAIAVRSPSGSLWAIALGIGLCVALIAAATLWRQKSNSSRAVFDAFWNPLLANKTEQPILLCPGAVVFSPHQQTGVKAADTDQQDGMVSPETARAVSQLTDLLGLENAESEFRLSSEVSPEDLKAHSAILIGAYSNALTINMVSHLRYRFSSQPVQSIYDATEPSILWSRPRNWNNQPGNDYGLFARVKDQRTGHYTVVIAGLGRVGTEATTAFITSPELMKSLAGRLPAGWQTQNLEVVLRTEVRSSKATLTTVEAVWSGH